MSRDQKGAVMIVEATFVFPIMFFIVFIMLMAGSAYFQQARIERIIEQYAIEAAACCENPTLEQVVANGGSVPESPDDNKIMPYRNLFTGHSKEVRSKYQGKINDAISGFGSLAFVGMNARLDSGANLKLYPHIITPTLVASCSFHVDLPIRMIFSKEPIRLRFSIRTREPVCDSTQFVRDVSTVQDYIERSKPVMNVFNKIGEALDKVAGFMN